MEEPPLAPRILYSNYRQLGFFNQFGEFSSLAKFVSGSQEVASPVWLSCQVRAALLITSEVAIVRSLVIYLIWVLQGYRGYRYLLLRGLRGV